MAEIDIGVLRTVGFEVQNFIAFCDVFTGFTYAEPIATREQVAYEEAIAKILKKAGTYEVVWGDGEFQKSENFFKRKNILLKIKPPEQHLNFVESRVGIIKKRLFLAMRHKQTRNWPQFLQNIVKGINSTPSHHIGM